MPDPGVIKETETRISGESTAPKNKQITHEEVQQMLALGDKVPTFLPERQQQLRLGLVAAEQRLNTLFPIIPKDRKDIASQIAFLATPEYFEQAILQGGMDIPDDPREQLRVLNSLFIELFNHRGYRSLDGKHVMVHTTAYPVGENPRQISDQEAIVTARHEMTHGKVEPKITSPTTGLEIRRTGCKVITKQHDEIVKVEHASLYEAQTDALAIIGAHPEISSWDEVFSVYLDEHGDNIDHNYAYSLSALTRLMQFTFPDFMTGVTVLGETYFRSDGQGFFQAIQNGLEAKQNEDINRQFRLFLAYSETNHPRLMSESVRDMIASAISPTQ